MINNDHIKVANEIVDFIRKRIDEKTGTYFENYDTSLYTLFLYRNFKQLQAIITLISADNGYTQDAVILLRSMVESYYLMSYFESASDETERINRIQRYLYREVYDHLKYIKGYENAGGKYDENVKKELELQKEAYEKECSPDTLNDKSVKNEGKFEYLAVNSNLKNDYKTTYATLCQVVHKSPKSLRSYITPSTPASITSEPINEIFHPVRVLTLSLDYLVKILELHQKHLHWFKSWEIKNMVNKLTELGIIKEGEAHDHKTD